MDQQHLDLATSEPIEWHVRWHPNYSRRSASPVSSYATRLRLFSWVSSISLRSQMFNSIDNYRNRLTRTGMSSVVSLCALETFIFLFFLLLFLAFNHHVRGPLHSRFSEKLRIHPPSQSHPGPNEVFRYATHDGSSQLPLLNDCFSLLLIVWRLRVQIVQGRFWGGFLCFLLLFFPYFLCNRGEVRRESFGHCQCVFFIGCVCFHLASGITCM